MKVIQREPDLGEREVEFKCSYCSSIIRAKLKEAVDRIDSMFLRRFNGSIYVFICAVCKNSTQTEIM